MSTSLGRFLSVFIIFFSFIASVPTLSAQSNSGVVSGTITDPVGAVIQGATVSILNPISGYTRSATTDATGRFQFTNIPLNSYHMTATAPGFGSVAHDAYVSSSIPVNVNIALKVEGTSTS